MATQIPLGDKFYLFRPGCDFNATEEHLLISAHGGYSNLKGPLGTSHLAVPNWTQLYFYADHGNTLKDPGIYDVMKGDYQVSETHAGGDMVTNYGLSKYQGSHGNEKETYGSISKDVDANIGALQRVEVMASKGRAVKGSWANNFGFKWAVLTVRNRKFKSDPSLKDALNQLAASGYKYENIHCSFCRSGYFGKSDSQGAQAFGT